MKPRHQIILTTIVVGASLLVGLGGLFSQINGVEERLTARINGVEERLTAQANGVEERLTARIDRFADRVDNRFLMLDTQNKEIIERLTRLETLQGVGIE